MDRRLLACLALTASLATSGCKSAGEQVSEGSPAKPSIVDATHNAQPSLNEGIVARVNGAIIDAATFDPEIQRITRRNPNIPAGRLARIKENILKRLIERELIRQAIEKERIIVTNAEVEASYKEYTALFQSEEQFQNYLKAGKVSIASIKARLLDKLSLERLLERRGDLKVSREECRTFYEQNSRFYVSKARVRVSHILLKLPEDAAAGDEKKVLKRLKTIARKLRKKGADFSAIAQEFSEGPSKANGGDLGYFVYDQMVEPFSKAAFAMEPGETSGPVRTRFGYHLLHLVDKTAERKKSFDEVKVQIEKTLRNKKFFKERRALLTKLRKRATVISNLPQAPPVD